jgi:mRNA-degrading endonuclease toxin of MazEF toxin-antitoxin module
MWPYTRGAVVVYNAPFKKEVCERYGILASHPVLIVNAVTPGPRKNYQCMMCTSKVDKYPGYRFFMNAANPKNRMYDVIRCNQIFTIETAQLGQIIGYLPPALVEKCVKAYGFEIGLNNEIPEYYANDETAMGWLNAGEVNVPKQPDAYKVPGQPVGSHKKITVATAYSPRTTSDTPFSVGGITTTQPITVDDAREFIPGDEETSSSMGGPTTTVFSQKSVSEEVAEEEAASKMPEKAQETPMVTAPEIKQDEVHINEPNAKAEVHALAVKDLEDEPTLEFISHRPETQPNDTLLTPEDKQMIEETRQYPYIKKTDIITKGLPMLTMDDKYDIWMGRLSGYALIKRGIANSSYAAKQLMMYVNFNTKTQKDRLVDGVYHHNIDLQYLGEAYMLAFRVMTVSDVRDIKMGLTAYETYAKKFGMDIEKTYIGELRKANLII